MTRKAKIFYLNELAGYLIEDAEGYKFFYDKQYISKETSMPVSLTLPLTDKTYRSNTMFSFFDGLIPEGWLLDLSIEIWKIDQRDRMSLLLVCCKDCIGAVSVEAADE